MDIESRSIDIAKTASIDMMTLNNKVVNMRQVVKRSKVHVINKLCRHIATLKKKKGTEEQKAKNLRKAERFLEEIDSIKKLKEDKVSKYALANTRTFADINKVSVSPGPRALGRLADHPLMKKVVSDFREQHHDWRDLAAYLLVKQTGRRFKTKKQKQKKLSKCVENINASETMTKAYIQERFGNEGLAKAEEKFERRRKRPKPTTGSQPKENEKENVERKEVIKFIPDPEEISALHNKNNIVENVSEILDNDSVIATSISTNITAGHSNQDSQSLNTSEVETSNSKDNKRLKVKESKTSGVSTTVKCDDEIDFAHRDTSRANAQNSEAVCEAVGSSPSSDQSSESEEEESDSHSDNSTSKAGSTDPGEKEEEESSEPETVQGRLGHSVSLKETPQNRGTKEDGTARRNECVVKELDLGGEDAENTESSEDVSLDESESDLSESGDDLRLEQVHEQRETSIISENSHRKKRKKASVPEFLTAPQTNLVNDPFFGSDDERGDKFEDDEMNDGKDYSDEEFSDVPYKRKVGSMFYNPEADDDENFKRPRFMSKNRGSSTSRGGRGRGGSFRGDRGNMRGRGGMRGGSFRGRSFGDNNRDFDRSNRRGGQSSNSRFDNWQDKKKDITGSFGQNKGIDLKKVPSKSNSASEKLHPSWEASKKRKAEMSGITAFKGSKITFDD
ncbi:unnamed protein product [Lymnaea stagnalis]|uniref:Serum response factor-binding protein 1 n=1 Tax=Lymnaea stagnalis TaxID=6523 RepID=A0AAV2IC99_LYMST